MGLLGLLIARSPGTALGVLALVVGAVACLEIDSRDVEVVDENAGEGNGATPGTGGTSGGKGGAATGGTTGGSGATTGSGATNATGGSANASTGGSTGAAPSAGGSGGAGGSSPNAGGSGPMGGSGGTQGGSDGTGGTGGSSSPGAGGASGAGGSGGAPVVCDGPRTELTIDGTRWMSGECNDYAIQGAWYCFTDDIADDDCDEVAGPRYDTALVGYCLSGTTIVDPEFKSWGAMLAFELQSSANGKMSYDASAHGVVGFDITVQGITSGVPLRVGFTPSATNMDATPFVEFGPLADESRTLTALIADAKVPPEWDVPTAGDVADPTSIADVQVQVVGGQLEAPYQFCVTHVAPIVAAK